MALAKVTWEDHAGTLHGASVKIEDTSDSGACIRITAPINIGSKLKVEWRGGRFSGVAKYCRSYREEYIVGIQRDARESFLQASASLPPVKTQSALAQQERIAERLPTNSKPEAAPTVFRMGSPREPQADLQREPEREVQRDVFDYNRPPKRNPSVPLATERNIPESIEIQKDQPSPREERKHMLSKWLHRESKGDRKDAPDGNSNNARGQNDAKRKVTEPGNDSQPRISRKTLAGPVPQGELLPLEDIYRAKGIVGLRMGYSINKVVEMLGSDHLRELSNDMRRASVLMALDVAGISVDEVLKDAEVRLDALNSYEAAQEKHLEEYEARKIQENTEIQAEMERVTAHYLDRLKKNLDDVAQMRNPFAQWQTMKQQESKRMSDAVGLCANRAAAEPPTVSAPTVQAIEVATKSPEPFAGKLSRV